MAAIVEQKLVLGRLERPDVIGGEGVDLIAASLLHEPKTLDQLLDEVGAELGGEAVQGVLGELVEDGIVLAYEPEWPAEQVALLGMLQLPLAEVMGWLDTHPICLHMCENNIGWAKGALKAAGFNFVAAADQAHLEIVFANDLADERIAVVNTRHLSANSPWLLVSTTRWYQDWMYFQPGEGPCWECLEDRIRYNQPERRLGIEASNWTPGTSQAEKDWLKHQGWQLAVQILQHALLPERQFVPGLLYRMSRPAYADTTHTLRALPACPACGKLGHRGEPDNKIVLQPRQKLGGLHSGSRTRSAGEAIGHHRHLVDPVLGLIREMKPLEADGYEELHVIAAYHSFSNRGLDLAGIYNNRGFHSTGKGSTYQQAEASALFESLERLSGQFRAGLPVTRAAYRDVEAQAWHPDMLQGFSETQIVNREASNARNREYPMLFTVKPFDETVDIRWVGAWNRTRKQRDLVPLSYAFYNVLSPAGEMIVSHSNGCASGSCYEEALLQGLYEILERDAVSLWWYNQCQRPSVAVESFGNDYINQLFATYRAHGRSCWVLDLTTPLGIPVYVALSRKKQGHPRWLMGLGCHHEPVVAAMRSLTEMNQLWIPSEKGQMDAPWINVSDDAAFLQPHGLVLPGQPAHQSTDIADDIRHIEQVLEEAGFELITVDQTDPNIGLPVVRAIVPSMYHFWRRLGGRRMLEAVVEYGWRDAPLKEHELNPGDLIV